VEAGKVSENSEPAQLVFESQFEEFFGSEKYNALIRKYAFKLTPCVEVDFEDVIEHDAAFAKDLLENPDNWLKNAQFAANGQVALSGVEMRPHDITIRINNIIPKMELRKIGAAQLNKGEQKLIELSGMVIRRSPKTPTILRAVYECVECGAQVEVGQYGLYLNGAARCPGCRNPNLKHIESENTFADNQEIKVQEKPEELLAGCMPTSIAINLSGSDVVDKARPGDFVRVVGVLRTIPQNGKAKLCKHETYVQLNSLTVENKEFISLTETPEIKKKYLNSPKIQNLKACSSLKNLIFY
jgi:DNA replicative helicase MCM subunit Mcm2 (Cdc46/Mcm family)